MTAPTIARAYLALPDATKEHGRQWYWKAYNIAHEIANESGHSHSRVCGVIARLSPAVRWSHNVKVARELCCTGEVQAYSGYTPNIARAQVILEHGWTPAPYGPKVNAFFRNILDPLDPEHVTLDRHMLALVRWHRFGAPHNAAYQRLTRPWLRAANQLNIIPNQLQASLWLSVKERTSEKSTRDQTNQCECPELG